MSLQLPENPVKDKANHGKKNKNGPTPHELLFTNDLQLALKYKHFPYLFITHISLLLISTIVILYNSTELDELAYHNRAIQSTFFFHEDTRDPSQDYKKTTYITNLPQLISHLDQVMYQIYNINSTLIFNVSLSWEHKINVEYRNYSNKLNLTIKDQYDNPLKNEEIIPDPKEFLQKIKTLSIELQYNSQIGKNDEIVTLELKYDMTGRGLVIYTVNILYSLLKFKGLQLNEYKSLLPLMQFVLAVIEILLLTKKVYFNLKQLMVVKHVLKLEHRDKKTKRREMELLGKDVYNSFGSGPLNPAYDNSSASNYLNSFSRPDMKETELLKKEESDDSSSSGEEMFKINPHKKKSKWNKLRFIDKLHFIPTWFIFFYAGALFQIMSSITYLSNGSFTPQNTVFFGFSALFSYISLGYYFQDGHQFSYVYDIFHYAKGNYGSLLVIFFTLFIGFALTHITMFPSSELYFNGSFNAFQTVAAEVFADSYLIIWSSTYEQYKIRTVLYSTIMFIIFTGCHLRTMFVMTEEAFQHNEFAYNSSNSKKEENKRRKKITVSDFINREIKLHEEEEEKEDNNEDEFFMDDIWINAIVSKDDEDQINQFNEKLMKVSKFYNQEQLMNYFYQKSKKTKRKERSKQTISEIVDYDFDNDEYCIKEGQGKTETTLIYEAHKRIKEIVVKVKRSIDDVCKLGEGIQPDISKENTKVKEVLQDFTKQLDKIKEKLK